MWTLGSRFVELGPYALNRLRRKFAMTNIGGIEKIMKVLKRTDLWPSMVRIVSVFRERCGFWTREQMQKLKCQTWMLLGWLSKPRLGDAESWVAALVRQATEYPRSKRSWRRGRRFSESGGPRAD